MKTYNVISELLSKKDKKTHHLRNAVAAGTVGFISGASTKYKKFPGSIQTAKTWLRAIKETKLSIYAQFGKKDADYLWDMYKRGEGWKNVKRLAITDIIKTGTIAGALSILLYGFYAFIKERRSKQKQKE